MPTALEGVKAFVGPASGPRQAKRRTPAASRPPVSGGAEQHASALVAPVDQRLQPDHEGHPSQLFETAAEFGTPGNYVNARTLPVS